MQNWMQQYKRLKSNWDTFKPLMNDIKTTGKFLRTKFRKNTNHSGPSSAARRAPQSNSNVARTLVKAPVSQQRIRRSAGSGITRVRHRELLGSVSGSTSFSLNSYPLNPGLVDTFPWLSGIAVHYESYHFVSIAFSYENSVSTSKDGIVMMAVDYNPLDSPPTTKQSMMSNTTHTRGPVWAPSDMSVKIKDLDTISKHHFVRTKDEAPSATNDCGKLLIATDGCADTSGIGELWVDYVVEFSAPQVKDELLDSMYIASAKYTPGSLIAPYATRLSYYGDSLVMPYDTAHMAAPADAYTYIMLHVWGTTLVTGAPITTVSTTSTVTKLHETINAGATEAHWIFLVETLDADYITTDLTSVAATATQTEVTVVRLTEQHADILKAF